MHCKPDQNPARYRTGKMKCLVLAVVLHRLALQSMHATLSAPSRPMGREDVQHTFALSTLMASLVGESRLYLQPSAKLVRWSRAYFLKYVALTPNP
jgi:hypothetical protein